jgi:hypothetical protein
MEMQVHETLLLAGTMGKCFFAPSLKGMHAPEGLVAAMARVFSPHGRARRMIAATIRFGQRAGLLAKPGR